MPERVAAGLRPDAQAMGAMSSIGRSWRSRDQAMSAGIQVAWTAHPSHQAVASRAGPVAQAN